MTTPSCQCGPRIAQLKAEITHLRAELERIRVEYFECWKCKAALEDKPEYPPHCLDCYVDDDLYLDWEYRNERERV